MDDRNRHTPTASESVTRQMDIDAVPRPVAYDPPAYTVDGFCEAHQIGRSYFNALRNQGLGPVVYKLGRRIFISGEAAAAWRRRMEAKTEGGLQEASDDLGHQDA